MQFKVATVALFSLVAVALADFQSLSNTIAKVDQAVGALNDQLGSDSVNTYGGALKVDQSAKNLVKQLNAASDATRAEKVFAAPESRKLVAQTNAMYPKVDSATSRVAALQPTFKRLGVQNIAKNDVNQLADSTDDFATALVNLCPPETRQDAIQLAAKFNAAMDRAVRAYA
ncbi:hypothetical protein V8E36_004154 [Tilletia maclaganii]